MKNGLVILLGYVCRTFNVCSPSRTSHRLDAVHANLVTVKGTVKSWLWSNPHCLLMFDVKGKTARSWRGVLKRRLQIPLTPKGTGLIPSSPVTKSPSRCVHPQVAVHSASSLRSCSRTARSSAASKAAAVAGQTHRKSGTSVDFCDA
jgi:hypothetical protein